MNSGGTPVNYLSLGTQSNTQSVVDYRDSQQSPDTGNKLDGLQTTTFTRVRIDPTTLIVNPNDVTYASSTGYLVVNGLRNDAAGSPPNLTLGAASQCSPVSPTEATALIDLSYTPFIFNSVGTSFTSTGCDQRTAGRFTLSDNKKTYTVTSGKGFCSDTRPSQIRLQLPPQ